MRIAALLILSAWLLAQGPPPHAAFRPGHAVTINGISVQIVEAHSTPRTREMHSDPISWLVTVRPSATDADNIYAEALIGSNVVESHMFAAAPVNGDATSQPFTVPLSSLTSIRVILLKSVGQVEMH